MSQALKPIITQDIEPYPAASPLDLPAEVFSAALERRKANRAALMNWIRSALKEGTDFGKIHSVGKNRCQFAAQGRGRECPDPAHFSKPCLMKPGAEKICGMLGVTTHFPTLPDYEAAALAGAEIKIIILRCELRDAAGRVVAEGVGGRSLAQDYNDFNKSFKMAEKSSQIDATLRMAGLSELFTQDLEDMPVVHGEAAPVSPPKSPAVINKSQVERLKALTRTLGLDPQRVQAWCKAKWGVERADALSFEQWAELVGVQGQPGKLQAFREAQDREPLTEAQREQVMQWLEGSGLTPEGLAQALGHEALAQVPQGRWAALREVINHHRQDAQKRQWEALPEDEKRRREAEMQAAYHRAETARGRSATTGT